MLAYPWLLFPEGLGLQLHSPFKLNSACESEFTNFVGWSLSLRLLMAATTLGLSDLSLRSDHLESSFST